MQTYPARAVIDVHDLHASTIGTGVPTHSAHVAVQDECISGGHVAQILCAIRGCVSELDPAVRIERLVARHVATGKEPGFAREWVLGSDERNAALVAATRDRADRVLAMP